MVALHIALTYHTVSAPAVLVIAGTIPVDLLVTKRIEIYKTNGRPYLGHKAMDWLQIWRGYVTQMLSVDGYLGKYLHRMGKTVSPYCLYQDGKVIDDAEYTFFEYVRWQIYRSVLTSINGTITVANIVDVMITSRENWASVANYLERILRLKKRNLETAKHVGLSA